MSSLTAIPLVTKLSNNVIRILGCNPGPMTLQGTNTYLVGNGNKRILIDSGDFETASPYIKLLKEVLNKENSTIEHLLITHWHHDHIGGVSAIQELLYSIRGERATVWKMPRAPKDVGIGTNETENINSDYLKYLTDEDKVKVDGAELQVKYTPGHTTDHFCLFMNKENIVFSGDCILGEGTAIFEDLHDYMMSLKRILEMKPSLIYPGHGPVIENPREIIQYYIDHREGREMEILEVLQKRGVFMSEMDVVKEIYKDTPEHLWFAAASNVGHHLEKLCKEGKVEGQKNCWKAC